jgi:hypothetical protein
MSNKLQFLSTLVVMIIIAASIPLFPLQNMKSNHLVDNSIYCPYYVSLQSVLANYPLLSFDKANITFIKQRMMKFEQDLVSNKSSANLITPYSETYYKNLASHGLTSVNAVTNPQLILALANTNVSNIDNFYFDEKLNCSNRLIDWKTGHTTNILNYNIGGMYFNNFTNPYTRILFSVDMGVHLGVFPGFFVNNQTTSLGTQYLTGMPILTALYVIPGYNFQYLGSYSGLVPWCAFWSGYVTDPFLRKLLNISGIDAFTVSIAELNKRIKKKETTGVPDATLLPNNARAQFGGNDFQTYMNNQSYGMTYLANQITYINPDELRHAKNEIKRYFARPEHHNVYAFTQATTVYYNKLRELKANHDLILERTKPLAVEPAPNGTTRVHGIVGERAFFSADCPQAKCLFVYNLSHAPGWFAMVNGRFRKIFTANFAFMATEIPRGQSTIWFIYQPLSSLFCYLLSTITLIAIFLKVRSA